MPSAITPTQAATILVVDDDVNTREYLRGIFETAGYRALSAGETASALRLLQTETCDLVLIDLA
jgi:DNA-binding response OmpR family regulator